MTGHLKHLISSLKLLNIPEDIPPNHPISIQIDLSLLTFLFSRLPSFAHFSYPVPYLCFGSSPLCRFPPLSVPAPNWLRAFTGSTVSVRKWNWNFPITDCRRFSMKSTQKIYTIWGQNRRNLAFWPSKILKNFACGAGFIGAKIGRI